MSQERFAEYNPPTGETPEKCEGVDVDHCATITNYYRQFRTSEVDIDESTTFSRVNLKYAFGFVATLGIMHFWSKNLMQFHSINPFEILLARGIISSVISLAYLKANSLSISNVEPAKFNLVILGAVIGFLSLSGLYLSLYTLSITDAFALDCLSVLVTTFIDYVIFQGSLKFSNFVGYICAIFGILFLVRPSYLFEETNDEGEKNNFVYGFIAGLISAFLAGIYSGILRRTFMKVNTLVSITYRQIATTALSPIAIYIYAKFSGKSATYTTGIWISLFFIGILGWLSSFFLYQVLKGEKLVSRVYPFKYILIVFGIFSDLFYFRRELITSTYIGLCLIGVNFVFSAYHLFYANM